MLYLVKENFFIEIFELFNEVYHKQFHCIHFKLFLMDFMTFLKKIFHKNMPKWIKKGPLAGRKWLLLPHIDFVHLLCIEGFWRWRHFLSPPLSSLPSLFSSLPLFFTDVAHMHSFRTNSAEHYVIPASCIRRCSNIIPSLPMLQNTLFP